ncbi:MAG: isocitrate/isopropylmalate family dehydrogenase, partial [Alphaproteobacteria bacterium]
MHILVLPGDGIGPEIVPAAMQVLTALETQRDLGLTFTHDIVGFDSLAEYATTLRPDLIERLPTHDGIILGPVDTAAYPAHEGGINVSAYLRSRLDLYA